MIKDILLIFLAYKYAQSKGWISDAVNTDVTNAVTTAENAITTAAGNAVSTGASSVASSVANSAQAAVNQAATSMKSRWATAEGVNGFGDVAYFSEVRPGAYNQGYKARPIRAAYRRMN